jgi:MarR family transcriptional regulator, 2-MHQ and catechol-resistance regulon repressor
MNREIDVSAPHLWTVLSKCHRVLSHIAERSIADTGLCLTDFGTLEALLHKGPLTITEIQGKVLLASGSMTAAVDRLEKRGLIQRGSSPNDRRAKVLHLTAEGKRVVEAAFRGHAATLEQAMEILSEDEKRQLQQLLKKLGLFAAGNGGQKTEIPNDKDSQE